jgi:hypothetical protein
VALVVGQFESPRLMMGHPELAKDLACSAPTLDSHSEQWGAGPGCCARSRDDANGRFTPAELTGERTGRRWVNLNFTRCHPEEEEAFAPRSAPDEGPLHFRR